jgi:hypothetical protein
VVFWGASLRPGKQKGWGRRQRKKESLPAVEAAGLAPHRADAERRAGSIHADIFQDLLITEFVLADLTIDNPNVWYEIGVRHALRASGVVMTYALRDRLPFDLAGQRMIRYSLKSSVPDPETLEAERTASSGVGRLVVVWFGLGQSGMSSPTAIPDGGWCRRHGTALEKRSRERGGQADTLNSITGFPMARAATSFFQPSNVPPTPYSPFTRTSDWGPITQSGSIPSRTVDVAAIGGPCALPRPDRR